MGIFGSYKGMRLRLPKIEILSYKQISTQIQLWRHLFTWEGFSYRGEVMIYILYIWYLMSQIWTSILPTCWKSRPPCQKSRPHCLKHLKSRFILRHNLDFQQSGLDFRQSGLDFRQGWSRFSSRSGIFCPKFGRFSIDISILHCDNHTQANKLMAHFSC